MPIDNEYESKYFFALSVMVQKSFYIQWHNYMYVIKVY